MPSPSADCSARPCRIRSRVRLAQSASPATCSPIPSTPALSGASSVLRPYSLEGSDTRTASVARQNAGDLEQALGKPTLPSRGSTAVQLGPSARLSRNRCREFGLFQRARRVVPVARSARRGREPSLLRPVRHGREPTLHRLNATVREHPNEKSHYAASPLVRVATAAGVPVEFLSDEESGTEERRPRSHRRGAFGHES
jgi:hypothetical protein